MGKVIDLSNKHFGRLTVIERVENKGNKTSWLCRCDCGNNCIVTGDHLKNGHTQSCGCLQKENTSKSRKTHGMSKSRLNRIWDNMKSRCSCTTNPAYKYYGGRGITVCDEWRNSFQSFADWSFSHGYADNLTIDRIDSNGNYEPSNCRWTTRKVQQNNRNCNHIITYNGETLTLKQWSEKLGISAKVLYARINDYHWDIKKAFEKTSL